eukprot:4236177-Alexandrium_andersonii.AAC.1
MLLKARLAPSLLARAQSLVAPPPLIDAPWGCKRSSATDRTVTRSWALERSVKEPRQVQRAPEREPWRSLGG